MTTSDPYEVHIRRGRIINTDPQRRCYNGCHYSSETIWSEWEPWMTYPTLDHAERATRLFAREDQQLKVVCRAQPTTEL